MSSTNIVDFSVRHNKSIERSLVFDGLSEILRIENLASPVYIGLGSVWFVDFVLAHTRLGVDTMESIERDEIVYRRAEFNRPYRTLTVHHGLSSDILPQLAADDTLKTRPWIVWLDFDRHLDEDRIDELRTAIEVLPPRSVFLTTFSALPSKYGNLAERGERLQQLFDTAIADEIVEDTAALKDESAFARVVATATENLLWSHASAISRPGRFIPAFSLTYQDTPPMATVGGYLSDGESAVLQERVRSGTWPGRSADLIKTPPLTMKEVAALQENLPTTTHITRETLQHLGFDLDQAHIDSFVRHYTRYPYFAQIMR